MAKRRKKIDLTTELEKKSEGRPRDIVVPQLEALPVGNHRSKEEGSLLPTSFGKKRHPFLRRSSNLQKVPPAYSEGDVKTDSAKCLPLLESFDICTSKVGRFYLGDVSPSAQNNGKPTEIEYQLAFNARVLRPGMVLLKSYIAVSEQVRIVKICQKLGIGPGGFYQPGYRDGPKLHLQMMCLGLDWDPQTRTYQNYRAVDGSEPPAIPEEFNSWVERAIQDSHAVIGKNGVCNVEDILPDISPNVCIVNFYTPKGRLGLHQDRDESEESLDKGLPVVSFSIGDSAEFVYGDQRDVDKAEKALLESGDVLIFGGKSRHIFHGVPFIVPNSAPQDLLEEAKLRPGRLNLTFRQS